MANGKWQMAISAWPERDSVPPQQANTRLAGDPVKREKAGFTQEKAWVMLGDLG
jgi:hypothetical protein